MSRWMQSLVGSLVVLMFLAPSALASDAEPNVAPTPAQTLDECAPPCGYIYPTIGLSTDVAFPYKVSKLPDFPDTIAIDVSYYWDMEQDGTGVPGDAEEMTIDLVLTKKPSWLRAEMQQTQCSFVLNPAQSEYEVCTVEIKTEVLEYPMTEVALEEFGKRLMVFATSRETGTFKQSYGVEDMRFKFDEAPVTDGVGLYGTAEDVATEESPGAGVLAPLVALGAAAAVARRRQ